VIVFDTDYLASGDGASRLPRSTGSPEAGHYVLEDVGLITARCWIFEPPPSALIENRQRL
jgi:hypothetical protein